MLLSNRREYSPPPSVSYGRIHTCSGRKITLCVAFFLGPHMRRSPGSATSCRASMSRTVIQHFPFPTKCKPCLSVIPAPSLLPTSLWADVGFFCLVQSPGCLFLKSKFNCYRTLKMEGTGIHRHSIYSSVQPHFSAKLLVCLTVQF